MSGESAAIDAAIARQVQRARADYRAGLISFAAMVRVLRAARETVGEEV